jgi:Ca2+-binding EF-hand superfamily protein
LKIIKAIAPKSRIEMSNNIRQSNNSGQLSDEDIALAFNFFNNNESSTKISAKQVQEKLEALNKKMTKKEIRSIFDGKDIITVQEVKELLADSDVSIDPVQEVFKMLDPTGLNYIAEERLKKIFSNLGYGDLTDEELRLLIQTGDNDGDGKIGLEDFRLLSSSKFDKNSMINALKAQKINLVSNTS